jgi:RNA polymerase sigma-70 factor, ECF subfamily
MSFFREVHLDDGFGPVAALKERYGFIPNLIRAQAIAPRLIESYEKLESIALVQENALSRIQKERIALVLAAALRDGYTAAARASLLGSLGASSDVINRLLGDYRAAGLPARDVVLLDFCVKLGTNGTSIDLSDIETLRSNEFDDHAVLEAVLVCAMTRFLSSLAAGVGPRLDSEPRQLAPPAPIRNPPSQASSHTHGNRGPYIKTTYQSPVTYPPFARFLKGHGFIPNLYRAQTLRRDIVEDEATSLARILTAGTALSRAQTEAIFVVSSSVILNTYCVAAHCNILRRYGLTPEEADQIAFDHRQSSLPDHDKILLDFIVKLASHPSEVCAQDIESLRESGFTDEQILDGIAVTACSNFLNIIRLGLGVEPDFELPPGFEQNKVHLPGPDARLTNDGAGAGLPPSAMADPDAALVAEAQSGNLDAFEALIRRHNATLYRTMMAILGNPEEAQDAVQDALLSAFKHIAGFQGRSKFSTWLISIARNTALQRLRSRKNMESLDEPAGGEEEFRPRQIRAWQDDPEQAHSKEEIRQIVERGIMNLPSKYRIAVMLRDIEQIPTEEVARQLGLTVPALKTRVLRGRLMLREALAPHFTAGAEKATV